LEDARSDIADKAYAGAIEKLADLQRNFSALKAGREARKELTKLRKNPAAQEAFAALAKSAADAKGQPTGPTPGTGPVTET
ncbi:hypothetical protein HA388_31995, partial [Escherichia coli]|nr:hypothetical protein [Escherichia coli]